MRISTTQILGTELAALSAAAGETQAAVIAAGAANQVVDFIDNVDEGAGIFKAGMVIYEFVLQGATAATADEIYAGVIYLKFDGTGAALALPTVEWKVDMSPAVTFNATLAANQVQLRASSSAGTDINFAAIRRSYVTAIAHV